MYWAPVLTRPGLFDAICPAQQAQGASRNVGLPAPLSVRGGPRLRTAPTPNPAPRPAPAACPTITGGGTVLACPGCLIGGTAMSSPNASLVLPQAICNPLVLGPVYQRRAFSFRSFPVRLSTADFSAVAGTSGKGRAPKLTIPKTLPFSVGLRSCFRCCFSAPRFYTKDGCFSYGLVYDASRQWRRS